MSLTSKIEKQLLAELSRRNTDLVTQWVIDEPKSIVLLVDLMLRHDKKISPRAAWVLEKVSEKLNEPVHNQMHRIINALPHINSSSTRRILAKILMLHTIPEEFEGEMLDFCITMLERSKEPVAVKANCMSIIFNLLPRYPDLKSEILAIIENQIQHSSVGLKSRFKVLKRQLKKT